MIAFRVGKLNQDRLTVVARRFSRKVQRNQSERQGDRQKTERGLSCPRQRCAARRTVYATITVQLIQAQIKRTSGPKVTTANSKMLLAVQDAVVQTCKTNTSPSPKSRKHVF